MIKESRKCKCAFRNMRIHPVTLVTLVNGDRDLRAPVRERYRVKKKQLPTS